MRKAKPIVIQSILDSAAELFGERPFHEVTMDDIAQRAGISKGTIYSRFKSKEDLYLGLILHFGVQLREEIQAKTAHSPSPHQCLLDLIQEVFRFHDRYPYFLEIIQRAEVICRGKEQLIVNRLAFIAVIVDKLRALESSVQPAQLEMSAVALMGMTRAMLQIAPAPRGDELPKWVVDHFLFGFCDRTRPTYAT